jgi:hypothetical protein
MSERQWPAVIASFIVLVLYGGLSVGAAVGSGTDNPKSVSTLIWFQERESGTDYYPVRMIVSNRYLRIDDGEDSSGFVLFNRDRRTIYSVDHDNRSVLVLSTKAVNLDKPNLLDLTEEEVSSEGSPLVGGKKVKIHRLYTNKQLCFEVASAAGLLEDAVDVLREFHRALAAEQAVMMQHMPNDLASDCDLSDMVFVPDRHLRFGFPVRQRDYNGKHRELRDFEHNYQANPRLFELPIDYRRITTGGLQG